MFSFRSQFLSQTQPTKSMEKYSLPQVCSYHSLLRSDFCSVKRLCRYCKRPSSVLRPQMLYVYVKNSFKKGFLYLVVSYNSYKPVLCIVTYPGALRLNDTKERLRGRLYLSSLLRSRFQARHATLLPTNHEERCMASLKTAAKETKTVRALTKTATLRSAHHMPCL